MVRARATRAGNGLWPGGAFSSSGERRGNRGGPRGRSSRAEDDASVRSLGGFAIDGCARGQIGGVSA